MSDETVSDLAILSVVLNNGTKLICALPVDQITKDPSEFGGAYDVYNPVQYVISIDPNDGYSDIAMLPYMLAHEGFSIPVRSSDILTLTPADKITAEQYEQAIDGFYNVAI